MGRLINKVEQAVSLMQGHPSTTNDEALQQAVTDNPLPAIDSWQPTSTFVKALLFSICTSKLGGFGKGVVCVKEKIFDSEKTDATYCTA